MGTIMIRGAGGKGGEGGAGGISESADTLSSVALARFIDLISEGPCVGLVNGEYSIYLDGVPLRDLQGTPNYKPFTWDARLGTQSQPVMDRFAVTQQENAVNLKILQTQGKVIRSISDANAEAVRVTVSVSGLSETSAQGAVNGSTVTYKLWIRVAAGTWVLAYDGAITGKTSAKYQRSHELSLTGLGAGPYEVAVERTKADASSALIVDGIYWDTFTTINYEKFTYPNSALVGVEIDARYFSQVPTRAYHWQGLLVKVPMNYDPVNRTYATTGPGTTAGAWDGTFKIAYTNNPAWCWYDLAITKRYGAGRRMASTTPDKWKLYQIGKYCDEPVPTGNTSNVYEITGGGGYGGAGQPYAPVSVPQGPAEPRFRLNCVLNTLDDAHRVLNQVASVFRGMSYWASGSVLFSQDAPTLPTFMFGNANVTGGDFNYEGSSRAQRHTTVMVGWNDPSENFRQKWEYIEDREGIARYGIRPTEMVAFGCTSRSQARRVGLWLLYTERMEKDAITFRAGIEAARLYPGEVGEIIDNDFAGVRWSGRTAAVTTTVVTLDAEVTLAAGAYTLTLVQPDGALVERTVNIASPGTFSSLTVSVALSTLPQVMSMWALASTAVTPRTVRLVGVRQETATEFTVTCLDHNPTKYAAIEQGVGVQAQNYSFLTIEQLPAVTGLNASENSFKPTVISPVQTNIDISWDALSDPLVRGYVVKLTGNNVVQVLPETRNPQVTVQGVSPGAYTIAVHAVNHLGRPGATATGALTVLGVDSTPPANVVQASVGYTVDPSLGVKMFWGEVADFIDFYEVRKGAAWESAVFVGQAKASSHLLGPLASTAQTYLVKAVDTGGNYSAAAASVVVTVTAPGASSVSWSLQGAEEIVEWTKPAAGLLIDHYEVRYGASFDAGTFVGDTKGLSFRRRVNYVGARTYWVAAIDVAGNIGTAASVAVNVVGPGSVTSPRSEVVDNNALLFWSAPATGSLPVEHYNVRKGATYAGGTPLGSNGNSTFTPTFEQQSGDYLYWVVAVDTAGNESTPVAIAATVNQPPDYVLRSNIDSAFTGTKTNMFVEGGKVIGPANTTETWAEHFSNNSWSSPADQIAAGYPIYINPSVTSGSYSEDFFYGSTALPATVVTVTLNSTIITGSVTAACQIYTSLDGSSWTAAASGATSVLVSNFKYVRVTYTFTCTAGANLIRLDGLNVKLSLKLKTDSGTFTITDANAGVAVTFNVEFVDADTPIAQPNGTTALVPIVDFSDVPGPTGFTVYLHNPATGVKVTGSGSWQVRGS